MTEKELEQLLRRALQPVDPGEGFSTRVMMRLARTDRPQPTTAEAAEVPPAISRLPARRPLFVRWAPVALAACAMAGIGLMHWEQEAAARERGLEARAQLLQALNIAGAKMNFARAAVIREERRLN